MANEMCALALDGAACVWPIAWVTNIAPASLRGALALLLGLTGCGAQAGGQTGAETDGPCTFEVSPLGLEGMSPLGFTPRDALSLAEGEHHLVLRWLPAPTSPYGPESGQGELVLEVTGLERADFAEVDWSKSSGPCQSQVRVAVRVRLSTAGGAFREDFETRLISVEPGTASFSQVLAGEDIGGSFAFTPQVLTSQELARVQVDSSFVEGRVFGAASAGLAGNDEGADANAAASFESVPLACWGDSASNAGACAM